MPASYKRHFSQGIFDYVDGMRRLLKAQALSLSSPSGFKGKLAQTRVQYDSSEDALMTTGGTTLVDNLDRMRARLSTCVPMSNTTGGSLPQGSVVIQDTSAADSVTTTTTFGDAKFFGVARENVTSGSTGYFTCGGYAPIVLVDGSTSIGDYLYTSTTAGKATPSTSGSLAFGRALSSGASQVSALLYLYSKGISTAGGGATSGSVSSIAVSGSPGISGDVVLVAGTNITLSQSGQNITITSGSSGAGNFTLIEDQLLGADSATVTFSSIAGTYKHLKLIYQARSTYADTNVFFRMRFNGDTGSNYNYKSYWITATENATATYVQIGRIPGASATSGMPGSGEILIPNYVGTTFHKTPSGTWGWIQAADTTYTGHFFGHWGNTAAITQIDFLLSGGNFLAGSRFTLYGLS